MLKIYKKILLISIFFVVYYIFFVCFDYYDFFGLRVKYFNEINDTFITDETGKRIRKEVPFPTMKYIADLSNSNSYSVIFGDSKSYSLNPVNIAEYADNKQTTWLNLSFGGCTLEESIIEFYYTARNIKFDKIIFELDCRALCPPLELDRLSRLKDLDRWELYKCYFFDYYNHRMAISNLVDYIKSKVLKSEIPKIKREKSEVVSKMLEEQTMWAKSFEVHDDLIESLIGIVEYCNKHNIELVFYSPPINGILYEKVLSKYNILEKMDEVKAKMSNYAPVYDMQFVSEISYMEDDWIDVSHYTGNICQLVEKTLAGKNKKYMRIYENGRIIK